MNPAPSPNPRPQLLGALPARPNFLMMPVISVWHAARDVPMSAPRIDFSMAIPNDWATVQSYCGSSAAAGSTWSWITLRHGLTVSASATLASDAATDVRVGNLL